MHEKGKKLLINFRHHWFLVATIFLFISCSRADLVEGIKGDTVVAVINGEDITVKELRNEINLLLRQFRIKDLDSLTPEEKLILKTNGLNRIIQNILLNMEVVSSRVFLARNEYKDAVNAIKVEYQGDSFAKYLEVEGISLEGWESKLKTNMLIKKMIDELVNSKVLISDDHIKRYYDNHSPEFKKDEQIRALHISVESKSEIKNILKQLKSDKDFSILAQMYSLGPEGPLGGDLGYFMAGQMPEEFDEVFGLKVGQISGIIKTPYGHHLFKVIDKKPASQMTFAESKKVIYKKLLREEQSREFEKWMVELKDKSKIKIKYDVLAKIYK